MLQERRGKKEKRKREEKERVGRMKRIALQYQKSLYFTQQHFKHSTSYSLVPNYDCWDYDSLNSFTHMSQISNPAHQESAEGSKSRHIIAQNNFSADVHEHGPNLVSSKISSTNHRNLHVSGRK